MFKNRFSSIAFIQKVSIVIGAILLFLTTPAPSLAEDFYPDLRTLPPEDLQFDTVDIDGNMSTVLRFTNTVWNAGDGPLRMYGTMTPEGETQVTQRIYNDEDGYTDVTAGSFVWHPAHNHWHFERFAEYQLWTRDAYERWIANERNTVEAQFIGYKTTFCIRETQRVAWLPGTPFSPIHTECGNEVQGLSVGWGDSYEYSLPEQWIELGETQLEDGDYVLRSVADPDNIIKESSDNDPGLEDHIANEAVTYFSVDEGDIDSH